MIIVAPLRMVLTRADVKRFSMVQKIHAAIALDACCESPESAQPLK